MKSTSQQVNEPTSCQRDGSFGRTIHYLSNTNQRDGSNGLYIKKTVKNKKESSATLLPKIS